MGYVRFASWIRRGGGSYQLSHLLASDGCCDKVHRGIIERTCNKLEGLGGKLLSVFFGHFELVSGGWIWELVL